MVVITPGTRKRPQVRAAWSTPSWWSSTTTIYAGDERGGHGVHAACWSAASPRPATLRCHPPERSSGHLSCLSARPPRLSSIGTRVQSLSRMVAVFLSTVPFLYSKSARARRRRVPRAGGRVMGNVSIDLSQLRSNYEPYTSLIRAYNEPTSTCSRGTTPRLFSFVGSFI